MMYFVKSNFLIGIFVRIELFKIKHLVIISQSIIPNINSVSLEKAKLCLFLRYLKFSISETIKTYRTVLRANYKNK